MATKNLSMDFRPFGILVMPLHPGWVKTDLGGDEGKCDSPEVVTKMVNLLAKLDESNSGQFLDFRGEVVPW